MRLVVPFDAVLTGLSAAWAHGVFLARASDPVEVSCATGRIRERPGLLVRADTLSRDEIVVTAHGFATSPARTAFDLARTAAVPRRAARGLLTRLRQDDVRLSPTLCYGNALLGFPVERELDGESAAALSARMAVAVSRVDAVLRAAHLPAGALVPIMDRHPGIRGAWSVRAVTALADPRAESPPESVMRVRVVLAGLHRPVPQFEIFDRNGNFVARPDLGWPGFRLGAEYDGAYHDERTQISKDRKRDVEAHRLGWRLLHFDSADLRDVSRLVRSVHAVMSERLSRE